MSLYGLRRSWPPRGAVSRPAGVCRFPLISPGWTERRLSGPPALVNVYWVTLDLSILPEFSREVSSLGHPFAAGALRRRRCGALIRHEGRAVPYLLDEMLGCLIRSR